MPLPTGLTIGELEKSSMPSAAKSSLRKWWDHNKDNKMTQAKLHAAAAGHGIRAGGEAVLVGGALGAVHALSPTGLDVNKVPVDGVIGAVALVGSIMMAHTEVGADLRNTATTALGILSFRKVHDMTRDMQIKKAGITPGGGAAIPPGIGAPISKIAGEYDPSDPAMGAMGYVSDQGFNKMSHFNGPSRKWGTGFFGADSGAEDPVVKAARYL